MKPEDTIDHIVGHYRIIKPIGAGGMAEVFLALDQTLQREVALKIFQPGYGNDRSFLRRFEREARVVAQLDHPNILTVHEYGEYQGMPYYSMPYLPYGSLSDRLEKQGAFAPSEAIDLMTPVLQALQYAHGRGLIHRDIKPGNILFRSEREPVLADFGLVKVLAQGENDLVDTLLTQSNVAIMGTPQYMAPEQIHGHACPQSDIYSVGVVLYEMLTGVPPFRTDSVLAVLLMHLHDQPRPLRELNPAISPAIEAVVMRALDKSLQDRFQQAGDLLQALLLASIAEPTSEWASLPVRREQWHEYRLPEQIEVGVPPSSSSNHIDALTTSTAFIPDKRLRRHKRPPFMLPFVIVVVLIVLSLLGGFVFQPALFKSLLSVSPGMVNPGLGTPSKPSTQTVQNKTDCPSPGTARPAMLPLRDQGSDPGIIYAANTDSPQESDASLLRYDVTSGQKDTIVRAAHARITQAQLTADGQWVLFVTETVPASAPYKIQLVRIDGQDVQTLYCGASSDTTVSNMLLSPYTTTDQGSVLFEEATVSAVQAFYQLSLSDGHVRSFPFKHSYRPIAWASAQTVYVRDLGVRTQLSQPGNVYLLDLTKNSQPAGANLQFVSDGSSCDDFTSGASGLGLFRSHCQGAGYNPGGSGLMTSGPSEISSLSQDGGGTFVKNVLFRCDTQAVVALRSIDQNQWLLQVENLDDHRDLNGLWIANFDGTKLRQLTAGTDFGSSSSIFLNTFSQFPWSNVSRNGRLYVFKFGSSQSFGQDALYFGSLDGGTPQQFAAPATNVGLQIAGWTTL